MAIFPKKSTNTPTAIEQLKQQSIDAVAIFDKTVKSLEQANTVAILEKEFRQKQIDKLNQEIGEINAIQETNNKVIIKINNIFKDED